eukprot:1170629-Amphidinium_carterae.1
MATPCYTMLCGSRYNVPRTVAARTKVPHVFVHHNAHNGNADSNVDNQSCQYSGRVSNESCHCEGNNREESRQCEGIPYQHNSKPACCVSDHLWGAFVKHPSPPKALQVATRAQED